MATSYKPGISEDSGFTLIELVIVIVVLGILASVGIPVISGIIGSSKISATRKEMTHLKAAIVGQADNGVRGYENDVGALPPDLTGLVSKPAGVADYNRFDKTGWNGPYIRPDNNDYLADGWGAGYIYDPLSRTIKSVGGTDTITVVF